MTTLRHLTTAALLTAFAVAVPAATGATPSAKVKAPRSGMLEGRTAQKRDVLVSVSGKSIQIAAFDFDCKTGSGRTSLTDIPLKKTRKGYRFRISAHGIATYSDEHADENASIKLRGQFNRTGRQLHGVLRVKTPHCGGSGAVKYSAKR